jgi:hypothetical protein
MSNSRFVLLWAVLPVVLLALAGMIGLAVRAPAQHRFSQQDDRRDQQVADNHLNTSSAAPPKDATDALAMFSEEGEQRLAAILAEAMRQKRQAEALDVEFEEVNALLRQADKLDAELNRLGVPLQEAAGSAMDVDVVSAPLTDTPAMTDPALSLNVENRLAASPDRNSGSPKVPATTQFLQEAATSTRLLPLQMQPDEGSSAREAISLPLPAPPEPFVPDSSAQLAAASAVPPKTSLEPLVTPAMSHPAPYQRRQNTRLSSTGLSAQQRRCQFITLRVQLGEEPSHVDQRFLREGCR